MSDQLINMDAKVSTTETVAPTSGLPEALGKFDSWNAVGDAYINLEKMMGNSVRLPSVDAKPEDMAEFYKKIESVPGIVRFDETNKDALLNKLGRPESADKYFELDEGATDDQKNAIKEFSEFAHKLGLTKDQAQGLNEYVSTKEQAITSSYQAKKDEASAALKKEWGENYETKLKAANNIFNKYAEKYPDAAQQLLLSGGNNTIVIRMLADLSSKSSERNEINAVSGTVGDKNSLLDRLNSINSDTSGPLYNPLHADHSRVVQERDNLYEQLYKTGN